jgi:hypothetical protein
VNEIEQLKSDRRILLSRYSHAVKRANESVGYAKRQYENDAEEWGRRLQLVNKQLALHKKPTYCIVTAPGYKDSQHWADVQNTIRSVIYGKKEDKNMRHLIALATLATSTNKAEEEVSVLTGKLGQALAEAKAKKAEADRAAAAQELLQVVDNLDATKQRLRTMIKHHNTEITRVKEQLNQIDRALAYGEETENFVPLLRLLGLHHMATATVPTEVPATWQPAAVRAEASKKSPKSK